MQNSGINNIQYQALDCKRRDLLKKLVHFKSAFYLTGGTALALQIGHRISVDFDFFTAIPFTNETLIAQVNRVFDNYKIVIVQNEKNTLTVLLDDEVKISFFCLEYENYYPLIDTEYFKLAEIREIGIMKMIALFRATYKDYVDLYFIIKHVSFNELIEDAQKKHPNFEKALYIKALLSYDDVDYIPIHFIYGNEVERENVFEFLENITLDYIKNSGS